MSFIFFSEESALVSDAFCHLMNSQLSSPDRNSEWTVEGTGKRRMQEQHMELASCNPNTEMLCKCLACKGSFMCCIFQIRVLLLRDEYNIAVSLCSVQWSGSDIALYTMLLHEHWIMAEHISWSWSHHGQRIKWRRLNYSKEILELAFGAAMKK